MSAIAFWRPKLSRTRAAKCGSGAFTGLGWGRKAYLTFTLTSTTLELPPHLLFERLDLGELRLEIRLLLQQARLVGLKHREEALELWPLVAPGLVHVDEVADFGEREAEPLAAERELEPRAVARRIDAALAFAAGREQALILVEADCARGDVELARELADREFGAFGFHGNFNLI